MLKVGFYLRELNFRGIANSIYIYAKNNQTILKNKSIIFYNSTALDNRPEAIKAFKRKTMINRKRNKIPKEIITNGIDFKIKKIDLTTALLLSIKISASLQRSAQFVF